MTLSDITILGKKILVGIIVTLVPFLLIFGSLWLIPRLFNKTDLQNHSSILTPKTKK